ncbi:MAG TPA: hypothetical protein VFB81_12605 [Myxococcales bacterium]|nr:hypothetical protein [Myxococcales bacterium]
MSSVPYRARPGAGFVLLVASVAAAAAFFAWGAATPGLQRVWRLQVELEIGKRPPLKAKERALFQETLERYPTLADALLDGTPAGAISAHEQGLVESGYAYVVRKDAAGARAIRLSAPPGATAPVALELRGPWGVEKATLDPARPFLWALREEGPFPQLLEVRGAAPFVVEVEGGGR